uniref:LRAT domain-containing protein n=1 Tax=Clytia hemisphaerica TaxID=252671 RepID=A0A7M5X2T2_9CNID
RSSTQCTEQFTLRTRGFAPRVPAVRRGDILQIKGRNLYNLGYSHYAIVVDDCYVIHVKKVGGNTIIAKEKLAEAFKGKFVRINNTMDGEFSVLDIQDIIVSAESMIGHDKWPYDLLAHNCEHFVT